MRAAEAGSGDIPEVLAEMDGLQLCIDGSKLVLVNTRMRNLKLLPHHELLKIGQGKVSESVKDGITFRLSLKDFVKISDGGEVLTVKQLILSRSVREIYMHGTWPPGKPPVTLGAKKRVAIGAEDARRPGGCNELTAFGAGCLRQ